jgi:hypothetical protein
MKEKGTQHVQWLDVFFSFYMEWFQRPSVQEEGRLS